MIEKFFSRLRDSTDIQKNVEWRWNLIGYNLAGIANAVFY